MKKKHKGLAVLLTAALACTLGACGDKQDNTSQTINIGGKSAENAVKGSDTMAAAETPLQSAVYKLSVTDDGMFINSQCELVIDEAIEQKVVITANDNLIDQYQVTVDDSAGTIAVVYANDEAVTSAKIKIAIGVPIEQVEVGGSYTVTYKPKTISNCTLLAAGACSVNMESSAQLEELQITAEGAAEITASGSCAAETVTISGAASADLSQMKALKAEVIASGASDSSVTVEQELNVSASGSATVQYSGNAAVTKKISGSATVSES